MPQSLRLVDCAFTFSANFVLSALVSTLPASARQLGRWSCAVRGDYTVSVFSDGSASQSGNIAHDEPRVKIDVSGQGSLVTVRVASMGVGNAKPIFDSNQKAIVGLKEGVVEYLATSFVDLFKLQGFEMRRDGDRWRFALTSTDILTKADVSAQDKGASIRPNSTASITTGECTASP